MKKAKLVVALLVLCLFAVWIARRSPSHEAAQAPGSLELPAARSALPPLRGNPPAATSKTVSPTPASVAASASNPAKASKRILRSEARYDWPRIVAFNTWVADFVAATPEQRETMKEQGLTLARARRPEFKNLIVADPERALEQSVKPLTRQQLPAEILAELEKPVSARGDFNVYMGRPAPGTTVDGRDLSLRYFETTTGESYIAHVFGEAETVMTKKNIAARGIAVDRELAIAPTAVRRLSVGEKVPAGIVVEETCPVSKITTVLDTPFEEPITEKTTAIELEGKIIVLCNGSHVRVLEDEHRLTSDISASGGAGGAHPIKDNFPGTSSEAIGVFKALYIRAVYPDRLEAPNTEASAMEDMKNFERFYLESSYGRLSVTPAFTPIVVLPHTREWYEAKDDEVDGLGLVHSHSRREARRLGFDSGEFNVTIVRIEGGPRLSGISWGGGDSVWVSWDGMDVINHECGHSIGRPHANFWDTGGKSAIGIGKNEEYGNSFDVMGGGGGFTAHYNTISKRSLGWLPAQNTHNPTVSGVYRIFAYDQPALEEGKRYGIRVPKDRTRGYNIEYHHNYGVEHTSRVELRNSAVVIWSGFGGAGHLIDTTPGTPSGKDDSGIEVGRTFSDPAAGVHFTVVNRNNNTSPESLDIAVNYSNPSTNVAPTLALTATTTNVAVNGSITFTAAATDANGDTLAYHWDFGDGLPSTNVAAFTRTFTAARQHNVLCTVSDMKGGTTRRHLVVVVGSPTRGTLYGRVTNGGAGVPDVLLTSSVNSKYTYTDAEGYYALADLATGAQTITPLLYGYTFTPASSSALVVAGANTFNLTASPLAQVSIAGAADALENGTNGAFIISRTGSTVSPLDVRVMSAGGTAERSVDYNFVPGYVDDGNYRTFTIPAGAASLNVVVSSINDAAAEGPETIALQLAEGTNYIGTTLGAASITLHDDDTTLPQVSVTADDTEATEVPGNVTSFTVSRTGSTVGNLNVALQYGGSATRGVDYPNLPSSVTIPAGQSGITLIVTPVDDTAVEGSENLTVTIPSGANYVLNTAATSVDLLILDDDIPLVTVTAIKPNASETNREPGVFLVSRTGPTTTPLKVYYGIGGTAQHGTDYIGLPAEITIPAGAASAPIFITPYDDNFGEGTETVDIQLAVFNGSYLVATPSAASITITDNNDVPHVSVISMSSSTSEPNDAGTLRFRLEGSRPGPTTVRYTLSGTATPGLDYTGSLSGTIVLGSPVNGFSENDVSVNVLDDAIKEDVESIIVTLTPDPAYIFFNDNVATIRLRDNDQPIVSITPWNTAPAEGTANNASFYIGRTGPTFTGLTSGSLTVNYAISGTAANGLDYVLLSGTAIIPNGSNNVDIPITTIQDGLFEGTETITLTLLPSPDYGIGESSATLYLADDESYTLSVGFLTQASTTSETLDPTNGEYRLLPVILSALNTNVVTVEYIMSSGSTAWGDGIDWDLVDAANGNARLNVGVLTFPIGVTNQFIKIRIYPDTLIEGTEMAVIELRNPSGCRLSTSRNPHDLTILDNTNNYAAPRVMFITGASSVNEDATTAPLLMAALDRPMPNTMTVNYAVTGGTATPGSDFTLANGTLTFLAGETSKSIPLAVINDTAVESSETVIVTLSGPTGGATLGSITAHTVTILDNDTGTPAVVVAATDATATENGDTGAFTITRTSGGAAGALTVNYIVSGTATAGGDYTTLPGSVIIPAGQAGAPVIVSTLDDGTLEPTETVTLTIIPAAGYSFGANISATVNILDDETQALPPVAQNQNIFVPRNQPSGITLTAIDPSGDPLTYSVVTPPAHGALTGTAPNLTFTPTLNYTGPDSFTFRATDGATTSAVATVSLTVYNSTLVLSNAVWRYRDLDVDQGTAWATNGFNDASWSSGTARLGFGDPRTTTVAGQPVITYYFRHKFTPPNGMIFTSLVARVQRDDGIVVHLNGSEAFRDNMPSGTVLYSTRPSDSVDGANESAWFPFSINPALLDSGTNIVAAEVHQINSGSSDIGFALELTGTGVPAPTAPPTVIIAATDASATEPDDTASFTVTRLGTNINSVLDVFYGLSGTATPGFDYASLPGVVTIPAGQSSAAITLAPLNDFDIEPTKTVVLTLAPGLGYVVETNLSAAATIADDDAAHVPPLALSQTVRAQMNQSTDIILTGSDLENDPLTFQILTAPANGYLSGTPPYVAYTPDTNFTGADSFTFRVNDGGLWSTSAYASITVYDPPLLVPSNSVWRYHDLGVDLGMAWRSNSFNDSTWNSGPARLGFGGDGEVTTLAGQPVITYYFRKQFITPPNYNVTNLAVSFVRDDGAVIYLNGAEVARDNMPLGPVLYSTRATNATDEQLFYTYPVNLALLQPGTNLITAEVHQVNSGSGDIGFDLQLRGDGYFSAVPPPPLLAFSLTSSNTVHLWFPAQDGSRYAIEGSVDLSGWTPLITNTASGGLLQYGQSATNPPVRFFRARQVP